MKLLLFLEHRFYHVGTEVYSERIVNYSYLQRYLNVFDSVTVCGRFGREIPEKKIKVSGEGVEFLELPDFQGFNGLAKSFFPCKNVIESHIKEYDAVMIRTPSPISMFAYPIVKKSGLPFAIEVVINPKTMFSKDSYPSKFQPLISAAFAKHTKDICMTANGVSYVTEHVLQDMYPCRAMKECSNPVYFTASYSTIDLKDENYWEHPHSHQTGQPFVISHTGYMDTYSKGHLAVIDVASKLIDDGIDVRVDFIGSGELQEEFEKHAVGKGIRDKIVFHGNLSEYTKVQEILKETDVFLFPTSSEGLPRSLIEAMANSCAAVSTPVDGITELLPAEYLANYSDINALYQKVRSLLINDSERTEVARINYKKAEKYRSEFLTERRNEFYFKLRKLAQK